MNIGLAIKKIRTEKGISQGDFAKACEVSQTAISQIENSVRRPNKSTLEKICKGLEVPETILYLYALEESDIPEGKKQVYELLYPSIKGMIEKLVTS
ncbi:MAG: helix-turn-helix domain-containing protein [Flavobacteriales bacterium]